MYKYLSHALCGSLLISTSAMAQGAPNEQTAPAADQRGLEEVVVTARRREESLQRVPVAVVAINQQQLENSAATDLKKLSELAPQVMIAEFGSGTGAVLTIRGISSDAIDFGLDQSVLVVVDGQPISNGSVIRQSLFDMQRVEVMEGPQALFFGKNSPAGVIALHTADPNDYFEASVKAGYEFEAEERFGEAVISGPITDTLSARLALRASEMEGWIDNVAPAMESPFHPGVMLPGNVNRTSPEGTHNAARLTLRWTPTEDFSARLKFTWDEQDLDGNGNLAFHETWCSGDAPLTRGIPQTGADCRKNGKVAVGALPAEFAANFPYARDGAPYRDNEFMLASLTLDKTSNNISLTSTTGYYDQTHKGSNCSDGVFCELFSTIRTDYEQVTQELRVNTDFDSPVNVMAGLYFEYSERTWFTAVDFFHANLNPVTNNYATFEVLADTTYTGYSAFAQVRWNILPSLEFAAGARYSHDKKDSSLVNLAVNPVSPLAVYPQGEVIDVDIEDQNVSPEATLTWYPTPNQTLYGAYKAGYKAGGISNPSILFAYSNPENLRFDREEADGFEIGYKASFFDDTLRLDLAAYSYDFKDLQVVSENINVFAFTIANAGAARTEGIQGSVQYRATDRLSLSGSFGYNDASYIRYPGAQCYAGQTEAQGCVGGTQDLSGKPTVRAPKLTSNLGLSYAADLIPGWDTHLSLSGSYTSSYNASTTNNPGAKQSAFWRLNAALHFMPQGGNVRLSLIGRNLTNEYYLGTASNLPFGGPNDFVGPFSRPRELILQAQYDF